MQLVLNGFRSLAVALSLLGTALAMGQTSFAPHRVLVRLAPGASHLRAQGLYTSLGAVVDRVLPGVGVQVLDVPDGADEVATLHALRSNPLVDYAELDELRAPQDVTPNDPWYANQWHLRRIVCPTAWSTTLGSPTITVAILDTGVDSTHPDLSPVIVSGWNIYGSNSSTGDVLGHGTQVAGCAVAATNNAMGVAAVTWNCRLMPIRISDASGNATFSDMASGLIWAADHGARVANISYMCTDSATVQSAAKYFMDHGGVVTTAAGNGGTYMSTPDNPYMLTTSMTTSSDLISTSSNYGPCIDVAAPGVSIYTTLMGGGYGLASGTSLAAPVAAGVAALVLSQNPALSGYQAQQIIKDSSDDLGTAGWDQYYGYGRVNASRAVTLAGGSGGSDTTPPTVSFASPANGATVGGIITVTVNASDNVGVTSVSLSIDGNVIGTLASAPYNWNIDTASLSNGNHSLTASAKDGAGNLASANVSVTVSNTTDTTPPSIVITSPTGGSVSGVVSVTVNATDNVGVTLVQLYVDGVLTSSSSTSPFTTTWNTRKAPRGQHTLQCKAFDAAGNSALSQTVTVIR